MKRKRSSHSERKAKARVTNMPFRRICSNCKEDFFIK